MTTFFSEPAGVVYCFRHVRKSICFVFPRRKPRKRVKIQDTEVEHCNYYLLYTHRFINKTILTIRARHRTSACQVSAGCFVLISELKIK